MVDSQLIFFIIKLALGGLTAFFAILLWSKTGDAAWMSLIAAIVINYAGVVYAMLIQLGILAEGKLLIYGLPLTSLLFTIVPQVFVILSLILMIVRTSRDD